MKTHNNLYERIVAFDNLARAAQAARRGKRGRPDVATFEFNLERELLRLQAELRDESYRPGAYRQFRIFEPKERLISRAPFRDRVVHHAICRVIEPLFEPTFSAHSFACRIGKGTHRALDRFQALASLLLPHGIRRLGDACGVRSGQRVDRTPQNFPRDETTSLVTR